MKTWNAMLLALGLALAPALHAGESTGTVFIDSRLLARPDFDAREVARVPADSRVDILERRGVWLRVSAAGGREGWIRRFDVRTARPKRAERDSGGWLSSLFSGGRRQDSQVTNTIGIRGLDAVDINNARSDPRAVARLDDFRASPAAAARLASDAGLRSRDVAYVTEGAASSGDEDSGGGVFDFNF